jgi:ubiquinone/menaquinone biosynthesis C-methylase UbiE
MTEEFFMLRDEEKFFGRIRDLISVKDKSVLDVGGAGEEAVFAHKMKEWGADVTVLDNSERRLKLCSIRGMLADASSIPLPDRSFDVVSAFLMLHEVPPSLHPKVLGEMKRVGKMIVILERRPSVPSSPDEEKLRERWDKLADSVGEIEKPQPKDHRLSMLGDMNVRSYDFIFVYGEDNEEKSDEDRIKSMMKTRGYPEHLLRECFAQARVVEQQRKEEGKRLEDSLYLIIGKQV